MNMKYYLGLCTLLLTLLLGGCDIDGVETIKGFSTVAINMQWRADESITYKYTLDNDTINGMIYIPRDKTSVILRVFKNNESTAVLEKETTLQAGQNVINLVQFPGSPVTITPVEADPSTTHHVRVRLFYENITGWSNSVKVDIFATVDRKTYTPTGVSVVLEEGKLSDYFELNLNQFFPANTSKIYYNSDITDVATGALLVDHSKGSNYGQIQYTQYGYASLDATTGWSCNVKSTISQMQDNSLHRFLGVFETPWK